MPLRLGETGTDDTMLRRWEFPPAVSIKISLNNGRIAIKSERAATGRQTKSKCIRRRLRCFRNAKFVFSCGSRVTARPLTSIMEAAGITLVAIARADGFEVFTTLAEFGLSVAAAACRERLYRQIS